MVTFKLISRNGDVYHYEFYPNGDETNPGTFIFNNKTMEITKKVLPKGHTPNKYFIRFLQGMSDKNGALKEYGISAWY